MKGSLYLGKISGIRLFIHWTFLILIAWIIFTNARAGLGVNDIMWSILFILSIFFCVTLHELGHALAAKRYDIKTRHIFLLPIGGVASLESIPEKPREELVVALAGPLVNLVLAVILYPFARFNNVQDLEGLATVNANNFIQSLMAVNIWLAIFNLIPAFPMDGGRVFRALLAFKLSRSKATRIAAQLGQLLAIGFVFIGIFYNPFLVFIGLFIFLGAQAESNHAQAHALLEGYTTNDVAMHEIPTISAEATIREATSLLLNGQNRNFLVMDERQAAGTLDREKIIRALSERGENTLVREVMDRELLSVPDKMPLQKAWQQMQQQRKSLILVSSDDGNLTGVIDAENLNEFLMIRTAQEKREHNGNSD